MDLSGTRPAGPFALRYRVEGSGPAALVIGSAVYYPRVFSPDLRRRLTLAFVDHRGFAAASAPTAPADYTLDTVLVDTEALRSHLGLGPVIAVGHSGNAYLALEYAKRFPDRVRAVVMIGCGPSQSDAHRAVADQAFAAEASADRKARLDADLARLPAEIAAAPERRFAAFCIRLGARSWADPAFDATALWDGVPTHMPTIDHLWGEAFRDLDITRGLAALDAPALLALGRFDYLIAPESAWAPYRPHFRDLTAEMFARSGHTPPFEEPEAFDIELMEWLRNRTIK